MKKPLMGVYSWLVVLTLLEVFIVMMGIPKFAGVALMIGTTLGKVLMIALYFMHMKQESWVSWFLPGIPVLLAAFFVAVLFPDLVWHLPLIFR